MNLLHFAIMSVAVVYVLTESPVGFLYRTTVTKLGPVWLKPWIKTLVYCPSCTGFWVGVSLYLTGWSSWAFNAPQAWLLSGCAGMICGKISQHLFQIQYAAIAEMGINISSLNEGEARDG